MRTPPDSTYLFIITAIMRDDGVIKKMQIIIRYLRRLALVKNAQTDELIIHIFLLHSRLISFRPRYSHPSWPEQQAVCSRVTMDAALQAGVIGPQLSRCSSHCSEVLEEIPPKSSQGGQGQVRLQAAYSAAGPAC